MTDEEFLAHFEFCTLEEFHHEDHIRMAWIYLRKFGYETGSTKCKECIKKFARQKWHDPDLLPFDELLVGTPAIS